MKKQFVYGLVWVLLPLGLLASLVPTAPADYSAVPLLSSGMKEWKAKTFAAQKSASASANTTARKNTEKDYAANSLPVRISWSGGAAPYAVRVVRSYGGKVFFEGTVDDAHVDLMNLEVGRNYTWTVTSGSSTATGHFFTEPDAPRAINRDECVIANTRDLGGWVTDDGKIVKQGMVYRSESFDYYTPTNPDADPTNPEADFEWTVPKTVLFQRFWNDRADIKTEIDLRAKGDLDDAREEYGFADSVISNAHVVISEDICGITFNDACYYNAFTTANGKKAMLSIITNFANSVNYPILFHCRYGKDRTGTLALVLNALLGVPEDSLRDDYAFTYYAVAEHKANTNFDSVDTMFTKLKAYAGDTLKDKTAAYLLGIGVTQSQIDAIRANLLEDPESPDVKPETDAFTYKNYYFRRAGWGGSWNSDSIYWYTTKTGTTKAFKSTDDPCYPVGADAAVWFYPYGSVNKCAFPVAIGSAASPAALGRIVTDNTYGDATSEIGFNALNAVFSNAGHTVADRTVWEHVSGVGMADVVRFFFDGAASNTYSLTMHPNTEMIFQFLTCYGVKSGALYTSNLSTSSTHASFKSSPAYLKFLPGGDQTVRVTEDGDTHLYSKIGWFTGGDADSTQTFVFENAFLELTNDNHDNAVLGKLSFDFRLGDYVKTTTALAMLRARGALTINPGSTLKVDAGQKPVGKYKLISSVKSLVCDDSFYTQAEITNLAPGTSATVTRSSNTLYLTVETATQPPVNPEGSEEGEESQITNDLVEVEYIENTSDAYVDTGIEIQDKIVSSVDHVYTAFPSGGSYMLAANGKINGISNDRLCLASVNKDKKWRVGLGSASLLTLSDYTTVVLNHRYVAKASVAGTSVKFTLTDKTAGTAAKSVTKTLTASVVTPDEPKTLTLFVLNTASLQYPASAKLYGCQIWTNGTVLARDYAPCYRRSTKQYGLWDKVSESFFPSDSTNGFVGPEVKEEEGEGDEGGEEPEPEPKVDLSALLPDEIKCVSIVAPSSQPNSNDVVECVRSLTKAGKTVKVYPGVWKRPDSGADRAREIEAAWQDLETDLILCARGGTGSFDTLKALDFEILKARDVPFMGFSNISTLLNGFVKMGVKRPIAGPLASTLATYPHTEESIRRAHAVLAREDLPSTQLQVRRAPSAAVVGKPLGGHVPSIASMTAEWIPDTAGRIIFLEYNSSYDYTGATNMFRIVKNRGWFDRAAAVVLCEMGISEGGKKEALREHITESVTCPVFSGYTFGHVPGLLTLDFGRNLTITPTGELTWGDFSETPVEPPPVEPGEDEGDDEEPQEPQTPVVVAAYKTLNAYLDTDAEGYIITDYVPKLAKTKIEFSVQYLTDPTRAKGGDALCCANGFVGGTTWGNRFHVFSEDWDGLNYENTAWDDVWVGEDEGVYQIISNPDAVVTISAFRQTLAVNDLTFTGAGDIPPEKENQLASGKLVLFAYADSKKNNYVRMTKKRVYSVKVWEIDGGVTNLVMDLVPAVAADGTKTLYDKVAKKCLKPTNGGGFAVGAATETAADAGMVEPTAVFEAANSSKRIVYPSTPTLSGAVGEQTVAFGSVSVSVPRHYTAKLSGNSVTLALNDFARPLFGSPDDETKAIVVGETTVTFHVGNRIDGLFYRVVTATALGGKWTPVTGFLPVADFTVDRIKSDNAAFYKIEVSDAN